MLNDQAQNGIPVPLSGIARNGNLTTVATFTPHGLVNQDTTSIVGVADATFNGNWRVSYVDTFTFTYVNPGPNTSSTGGLSAGQYDIGGIGLGALFNDPYLMPYVNAAYRKVQRALAMTGTMTFREDNVLFTIPAITGMPNADTEVAFNDQTLPPLPNDLLEPLKLWERQAGSSNDYVEMNDWTSNGGLPPRVQQERLVDWEWRSDGIYFNGATQDTEIRLRYRKSLGDITDGTGTILMRNSQDCVSFYTAAMASGARGSPQAGQWDTAAEDALENLVSGAVRQQQDRPRRRRAYSSAGRGRGTWL